MMKRFPKSIELYKNCVVDGNHPVIMEAGRGFFVAGVKVDIFFGVVEKTLEELKRYFHESNKNSIDTAGLEQLAEFFYAQCVDYGVDERCAKQITINAVEAYAKYAKTEYPEMQSLRASSGGP